MGRVKMCGLLKRLRHAMRGGLLGHLLSRAPEFLPCSATVVIPDSDRHMVEWKFKPPVFRCDVVTLQEDSSCQ